MPQSASLHISSLVAGVVCSNTPLLGQRVMEVPVPDSQ